MTLTKLALDTNLIVPIQTQPLQILNGRFRRSLPHPGTIQILDPQKQFPALLSHRQPGKQKGAGIAQMENTGRTGGEPADRKWTALTRFCGFRLWLFCRMH